MTWGLEVDGAREMRAALRRAGGARIQAGRASVPYALPIHWGWKRHGIAAQPWVSEAAQATEAQWTDLYLDGVQKIMDGIGAAT